MNVAFIQAISLLVFAQVPAVETTAPAMSSPVEAKTAFIKLLDRPKVALDAKRVKPDKVNDGLVSESLSFASEKKWDGTIERVPALLVRPEGVARKRPAVIALHGTGGAKEGMRPWLVELARRGIIGVAIDARYHGDRVEKAGAASDVGNATSPVLPRPAPPVVRTGVGSAYVDAITRAWRTDAKQPLEHPLYFDTCWDIWRTVDYLVSRDDIDPKRIGMVGVSMGGIETWLAASVDDRIAVAVPAIAVQSFRWSLDNGQWQGRARTVAGAHNAAAKDLGEHEVNARVCKELWSKVLPGILGPFDCPSMIRLFAGRPLLILNGERDPNCPIGGANLAFAAAQAAYKEANAGERLQVMVAKNVAHAVTNEQKLAALEWFTRWLRP
jgi:dienelactone hydrolase